MLFFALSPEKNCLKVEIGWIGLFTLFRLQKMDTMDTAQATQPEVYPLCSESSVKQFVLSAISRVGYPMTYGRLKTIRFWMVLGVPCFEPPLSHSQVLKILSLAESTWSH